MSENDEKQAIQITSSKRDKPEVGPGNLGDRRSFPAKPETWGARNLRPPTWNEIERIVDLVKTGLSYKTIARTTGIKLGRINQWLREGEDENLPNTDARKALAQRCARAEQERIARHITRVHELATSPDTDPSIALRAATWLLEREDPDTYNLKNRIEHTGALDVTHHAGKTTRELHEEYRQLKEENEGGEDE